MVKILLVDGAGNTSLVDAPSLVEVAQLPIPAPPGMGPVVRTVEFFRTRHKDSQGHWIYRMANFPHVNPKVSRDLFRDDMDQALSRMLREMEYKMEDEV